MPNEIALIEENKLTVVNLFDLDYVDIVIKDIKKNVKNLVQDMTTEKGRKQIASTAYTIAKLKTRIDNKGKELTEDWARQKKAVDNGRKKFREELDTLKEEIRKPLTEWENKDKKRIEDCNSRLMEIEMFKSLHDVSSSQLDEAIKKVNKLYIYEWEEFKHRAKFVSDESIKYLQIQKEKIIKSENEKIELEKLRKQQAEREIKDREEKIKKDATEKAELEAKEKAEKETLRVEEEKKQAELEAKNREETIKKEKLEAENRAKEQERLRKEAEIASKVEAKRIKREAEEKAKRDVEEAIKKEKDRVETERLKRIAEAEKREANTKHKAKINNEILDDLVKIEGTNKQICMAIITAIAKNEIRNLSIKY